MQHPPPAPSRRLLPLVIASAVVLLGACVSPIERPADCDAPAVVRDATLTSAHQLEPETITVCRDQAVTLAVDIQTDGVLHLHGYDDQASALEVTAGTPITLAFDAVHPGQFVIELHTSDGPAGLGVGILTVDEP
ncbi:MAG: hypothetical protein ABI622_00235 [Chloroflexota bacterium]